MPYIETIVTPQSLHIGIWHLTEDVPQLVALWGKAEMPPNYARATSDKRQREIAATALLIRHMRGCDIAVQHTDNGAPYIDRGYISISHTSSYVAVAFHPTRRVGIDIEMLGTKAIRVMERFMSSEEMASLPHNDAHLADGVSARAAAIHLAWSVKEAVYKICPHAVEFREDILIERFKELPSGTVNVHLPSLNHSIEAHYTLYRGCSLAWALE